MAKYKGLKSLEYQFKLVVTGGIAGARFCSLGLEKYGMLNNLVAGRNITIRDITLDNTVNTMQTDTEIEVPVPFDDLVESKVLRDYFREYDVIELSTTTDITERYCKWAFVSVVDGKDYFKIIFNKLLFITHITNGSLKVVDGKTLVYVGKSKPIEKGRKRPAVV